MLPKILEDFLSDSTCEIFFPKTGGNAVQFSRRSVWARLVNWCQNGKKCCPVFL